MNDLSFCLKAVGLHDDDVSMLTDAIEDYHRAGVPMDKAQEKAIADVRASVLADRKETVAAIHEQHPDAFQAAPKPSAAARAKARMSFDVEKDGVLQALAKMGGIQRDVMEKEFGLRREELQHTVDVGGLKGYPFRKSGGMDLDRALTNLEEAGYFRGVPEDEIRTRFEEMVHGEMAGDKSLTTEGQMRSAKEANDARLDENEAAEREALLSDAEMHESSIDALDDDDIDFFSGKRNVSTEHAMRELGFSEQEIQDGLRQEKAAGRRDENSPNASGEAPAPDGPGGQKTGTDAAGGEDPEPKLSENADFGGGAADLARPDVSETSASSADAAAVARIQGAFQKVDAFKGLKLTAMPRLERPGPDAAPALQSRFAAADMAEKVFGKRVVFFDSNIQFANGMQADYLPHAIFINEATSRPIMAVIGHELLHSLQQDQPELYKQLTNRLSGLLEEPGRYHEQLNARRGTKGLSPLSFDKLREELHADIVGDNFTDPKFWAEMTKEQPTGFGRVLRVVQDFFDNLLSKLRNERPFGTDKYLNDVVAARKAVADAMRQFADSPKTAAAAAVTEAGSRVSATDEPFYSDLSRHVERAPMKQGTGQAWGDYVKGLVNKGLVKQDEVTWTGLDDFLKMQDGKVPRDQVMAFLDGHGVKVTEKTLGAADALPAELATYAKEEFGDSLPGSAKEWQEQADRLERTAQSWQRNGDTRQASRYFRLSSQMGEMAERMETGSGAEYDETKYSQYTLPGGKNYRELLLTLPEKKGVPAKPLPLPSDWTIEKREDLDDGDGQPPAWAPAGTHDFVVLDSRTDMAGHGATREAAIADAQRSMSDSSRERAANPPTGFRSSHFDEPNILAHVRFNERTDAEGKKVLFIEELQSDWAQQGKRVGIKSPADDAAIAAGKAKYAQLKAQYDELEKERDAARDSTTVQAKRLLKQTHPGLYQYSDLFQMADREALTKKYKELQASDPVFIAAKEKAAALDEKQRELYGQMTEASRPEAEASAKVPNAPFVGKTDAWVSLAIKRMVKYAVDNNMDRVAFINGEQSAARYDLSKQIDRVTYSQGGVLRAYKDGETVINKKVEAENLPDYIGKEVAQKLVDAAEVDQKLDGVTFKARELSGVDLKVGGEGMKAFYDQIVPSVAKDVVRKLGGKLSETKLATEPSWDDRKAAVSALWPNSNDQQRVSSKEQDRMIRDYLAKNQPAPSQLAFDITPAMREKAAGGLPMFSMQQSDAPAAPAKSTPGPARPNKAAAALEPALP